MAGGLHQIFANTHPRELLMTELLWNVSFKWILLNGQFKAILVLRWLCSSSWYRRKEVPTSSSEVGASFSSTHGAPLSLISVCGSQMVWCRTWLWLVSIILLYLPDAMPRSISLRVLTRTVQDGLLDVVLLSIFLIEIRNVILSSQTVYSN